MWWFAFGLGSGVQITNRDLAEGGFRVTVILLPFVFYAAARFFLLATQTKKMKKKNPAQRYRTNLIWFGVYSVLLCLTSLVSEETTGGASDIYKLFGWGALAAGFWYLLSSIWMVLRDLVMFLRGLR